VATPSKKPATKARISSEERRIAIVEAALPLFVDQGFRGVTTKMIAKGAGVSEALLYQHFPSKDALYEAVQDKCCTPHQTFETAFADLEPSTEKLVAMIFTMATIMVDQPKGLAFADMFPRLIMHSLVEDGTFARQFLSRNVGRNWPNIEACLKAAQKNGDLEDDLPLNMQFWLMHHTLVGLHMMCMPETPAIDYKLSKPRLIDAAMRYVLRGAGLKPEAIKRCYDFKVLNKKIQGLIAEISKGLQV
jgi:AcrR family transcriptional regulator